jgi:amidase
MNEGRTTLVPAVNQNGDAAVKSFVNAWIELTPPVDLPAFSAALGRRAQIARDWNTFLEDYPIIITPDSWAPPFPTVPVDYDTQGTDAVRQILNVQSPMLDVPLVGLPGLSVPTGVISGMPTGVQVIANRFREDLCFDVGQVIEAAWPMGTPISLSSPSA